MEVIEDTSNQSLVFLIDRLNVTKLVGASPPAPLHFRSTPLPLRPDPTRLIEFSDFERLLERVRLRLFDNTVCLPVSRFGAH